MKEVVKDVSDRFLLVSGDVRRGGPGILMSCLMLRISERLTLLL